MAETKFQMHLRAALDEVVALEKQRLHDFYDRSDAKLARRVEMLRPLLSSLKALDEEVGHVEGLTVNLAPHGHIATIRLESSTLHHTLSISTSYENECYEVEEKRYYTFGDSDIIEERHKFEAVEDALALVVTVVGKHIAQLQALAERPK